MDMVGRKKLLGAVIGVAVALVVFWPSKYERVRNLGSPNSAIISFGDSLTAGYGAGAGEDYPSVLSKQLGVSIVNAGKSGDTTASALARIDEVLAASPRIVILGLGGNDYLQGVALATTEANLRTIIQRIQQSNAMVVLLGFSFPSLNANYASMYERVADDERCLLVEGVLKGILTDRSLKSDEIHPNARGYALMAERIAGPCAKLLQEANDAR